MIKHINHQNVSTTPFVAAKSRDLSNIQNDDTVILEPNAYPNGTNVSLDYVDFNSGDPIINRECDIALEQQGEIDSLGYEEGITGSANFNSASDPRNTDGTYQSLVYTTTKNAFYNSYRNPTEIFGVEHIDFPLSKTLRNLSDHFRMFTIPRLIFGDKIQPKSVQFYDTLLDDNVSVFDDGYQNLMAGYNLFSKVQEVRILPSGSGAQNEIRPGTASYICVTYDNKPIKASVSDRMSMRMASAAGEVARYTNEDDESGSLSMGFASGSSITYPFTDGTPSGGRPSLRTSFHSASATTFPFIEHPSGRMGYLFGSVANVHYTDIPSLGLVSFVSASVFTVVLSASFEPHDTASIASIGFYSGSLFDVVVRSSGSQDTASITNMAFYSGSVFNVVVNSSGSADSGSFTSTAFYSGSVFNVIIITSYEDYSGITNVGFYTASVSGAPPP
jgi:hypothetical protein